MQKSWKQMENPIVLQEAGKKKWKKERKPPTRNRKPEISVWKGAGVEDWNYRCRPFIPEKTPFSQLGMYETLRLLEGAGI
ncbi:hypothetical protein HMPREF1547_03536 [Blautia sp. KLE 1732]|nr:hypothetical protein HMPREF1547_03536 [Blautia sp. KLE 1732]